jgi:hypothetical protein
MTRENFDRAFEARQRRRPWKPFTLELVTGSRIEVNHPESLSWHGELLMCKSSSGLQTVFECTSVVQLIGGTGPT